jgi:hypothetical protein
MVKFKVEYEDGSYDLIKCPECNSEDISHDHNEEKPLDMICSSCLLRFEIEETDRKIIHVTTESESRESPTIISGKKVKAQQEYEEMSQRLRKERDE